jgi:hypothetical protein
MVNRIPADILSTRILQYCLRHWKHGNGVIHRGEEHTQPPLGSNDMVQIFQMGCAERWCSYVYNKSNPSQRALFCNSYYDFEPLIWL